MSLATLLQAHLWTTMGPLFVVGMTAIVVMVLELFLPAASRKFIVLLAALGVVVAGVVLVHTMSVPPELSLDTMVSDGLATVSSMLLLATGLLVLLLHLDVNESEEMPRESSFLLLFALVGALAMVTAVNLVALYIGLELLSVSSYVLVALRKRHRQASVEGSMKYLVMGGIGSAVFLYGVSFIYGLTGQTSLYALAQASLSLWQHDAAIAVIAFLLIVVGLGIKLSLVPFHMWTPDAYEGAPSSVAALISTLSKTATFALALRVLVYIFNGGAHDLFPYIAVLAAITMLAGNWLALTQHNLRRLLAFSSVAQAGYLLIPIALFGTASVREWPDLYDNLLFYLAVYTFLTIGAFAVLHLLEHHRDVTMADGLTGFAKKSPWLAASFIVFLLGLAGMPLTGGFVGKFYIFTSTVQTGVLWLGIVLFATSVLSFFYYFGLIRTMFQSPLPTYGDAAQGQAEGRTPVPVATGIVIALCLFGTVALGVVPGILLHPLALVQWF
ncbi:NADH-quinone oxidoreductase subunit N [Alicyclobacillus sp. SP_1]|jgi:NADH-quinone oxidoreductase subunit N|uniref:NADH-quinone oxidoreductase subunit N n=1 Tax=Alicyclobacillus sp. SP_1 TaxID=2942475 RepID=UPI0021577BE2|nr:NADH-quinone oxidoreductase subunit N [Alicyclobacillus sp. SP_1]